MGNAPNFNSFMKEEGPDAEFSTESRESIEQYQQQFELEQSRQHQQGQPSQINPFDQSQFSTVNIPDQPITYGSSIAESLLNNSEVPEEVREKFWFVFHKDNVLTFLDEPRKASKLMNFDITKIDILNSIPYYDYTFERELELGIMRNMLETKLDRALGSKVANIKNERTVLQSQFSENRHINENSEGSMNHKHSFFKRLLGRR